MFLVGELDSRDYFKGCGLLKIKVEITKEDLAKAKDNQSFQVINLSTFQFYDPEENEWVEFDRE